MSGMARNRAKQHTCKQLGQDGAIVMDGVRLIALSQLAQGAGKAEQGLIDLAPLTLPQQLRIHQQLLCTRHVDQMQPRDLHNHLSLK